MQRYTLALACSLAILACGDDIDVGGTPTVDNLSVTTEEDTPVMRTLAFTGGDTASITITLGQPMHGTVALSGTSFTYTPAENYNGGDELSVRVSDRGREDTATISITVTPVNDSPVGVADSFATDEDVAHEASLSSLLANDSDVDGDTLAIASVGDATNGTVALTATDVVFTPQADFVGTGTYRYTVSDGTETADVTVTIAVGGVNDAPVAVDDTGTTAEDTDLVVAASSLTANDTDADNQTLTVTAVTAVTGGTVALAGGDVTFSPAANFNGTASYTYTVSDGALTDTGTVVVTVTPVNDAPVATDDAATTTEDVPVTVLQAAMLANDTDVDTGTTLTVTAAGNPVGGTLTFSAGDVTFTPTPNFAGAASFEYTVSDGTLTDTGLVAITVTAVNDAPVAVDDVQMTNEDVPLVFASSALVANDTDAEGDPLTVTSVQNPVNGTVVLAPGGQITFTPNANFNGAASYTYTVSDGALTDIGTVAVAVIAINDAPVANDDTAVAPPGASTTYPTSSFLANDTDVDGNTLAITAVSNPSNGALVSLLGTTITFTPAPAFTGTVTFDYTVSDGAGGTATGTVTVDVKAPDVCGDGVVSGTEVCDDGNTTSGDGCDNNCTVTACGNGVITSGEACDDGNVTSGDGCDNNCTVTACGNGVVTTDEVCDDGNATSGDGCDNNCTVTACGNGVVTTGETCDDGNLLSGDGCDNNCTPSGCGNGVAAGSEACDDGNADDTDGCTTQCVIGVVCAASALADGDRFATDPATGTCYVSFDSDALTYAAAQTLCVANGGYLATITSATEQALVHSVQNPAQNPWIGGDDTATEGTFRWVTGEPFGFTSFAASQPDDDVGLGGNGDCLHLFNAAGEWNDTSCTNTTFVVGEICELEVDPCGDGVLQPSQGEACDDGNQTDGDGCSATCAIEYLVQFSFDNAAGNEIAFAADSTHAGLAATPMMSRGSGIAPGTAAGAFSSTGFTTVATLDVNDYYTFTVTPSASMTLTALELDERRSGTGIRQWSVRSSLDGFATDLGTFSVPDDSATRIDQRVVLGAAFQNVTVPVEFRIYGFAAEAAGGTWRIDNVQLAGTVTP